MGKRRVRCLQAHGVASDHIRVFDRREDRRQESKARYNVDGFASFEDGMDWNPDVVIVSLPSKLHMDYCLAAATGGKKISGAKSRYRTRLMGQQSYCLWWKSTS